MQSIIVRICGRFNDACLLDFLLMSSVKFSVWSLHPWRCSNNKKSWSWPTGSWWVLSSSVGWDDLQQSLPPSVYLWFCASVTAVSLFPLWIKSGQPQACVPYIATCASHIAKLLSRTSTSKVHHEMQKE